MHFDKSLLGCAQAITKVLQCLLTQQQSTPMMMHSAVKAADNTNQVEEKSGQSDHESDRTKDDEHLSDANNILMLDDSTTGEEELIHSHTSASDDKIEHVEQENNMGATNGGYCFGRTIWVPPMVDTVLEMSSTSKSNLCRSSMMLMLPTIYTRK